jgi:hypothetical protein
MKITPARGKNTPKMYVAHRDTQTTERRSKPQQKHKNRLFARKKKRHSKKTADPAHTKFQKSNKTNQGRKKKKENREANKHSKMPKYRYQKPPLKKIKSKNKLY